MDLEFRYYGYSAVEVIPAVLMRNDISILARSIHCILSLLLSKKETVSVLKYDESKPGLIGHCAEDMAIHCSVVCAFRVVFKRGLIFFPLIAPILILLIFSTSSNQSTGTQVYSCVLHDPFKHSKTHRPFLKRTNV